MLTGDSYFDAAQLDIEHIRRWLEFDTIQEKVVLAHKLANQTSEQKNARP